MAGRNGVSMLADRVIRLGDLTPERTSIEIMRDGEVVTLSGYVKGKRCPIPVTIQYDAARQTYINQVNDDSLTTIDKQSAGMLWVAECLKAVIPGLNSEEADLLAADDEAHTALLIQLGWWRQIEQTEPDADPEAVGTSQSIMEGSSPA
jgi:hypothetical protein